MSLKLENVFDLAAILKSVLKIGHFSDFLYLVK